MPSEGERASREGEDAIHLEEIALWVRIGVPEEERAQPQRLTASLTLWPRASFAGLDDRIEAAVDYAQVVAAVRQLAEKRSDRLVETLAEALAADLLEKFALAQVRVELRKFILPEVKHVAVIITRPRRETA